MKYLFRHKDCPVGGEGVHAWLYHMACRCDENKIEDSEAVPYIRALMTRAPSPTTEIEDALSTARGGERKPAQVWPPRDRKLIQEISTDPEPSWGRPLDVNSYTALKTLFPGNPLLCLGYDSSRFATAPLESFRATLAKRSLIVPSPMTARQGRTKAGHMSMHSIENTGPRRFIVCENDWAPIDKQKKLIARMAKLGPLVMVVSSGGKSLHAWFYCDTITDEHLKEMFFNYAVKIGFDPRTWLRSQFVRLPAGTRDNGNAQPVLFLDPSHLTS